MTLEHVEEWTEVARGVICPIGAVWGLVTHDDWQHHSKHCAVLISDAASVNRVIRVGYLSPAGFNPISRPDWAYDRDHVSWEYEHSILAGEHCEVSISFLPTFVTPGSNEPRYLREQESDPPLLKMSFDLPEGYVAVLQTTT